ncbi:Ribose-phosphate pyrophosphokinase [Candidatus Fokinia solitaria]|uniref:ribose-phosphate diphosphokinase n=1 Tax=Candidatus Fokinia solitaria TaxID=1802984 RepID=A0A2U8BRZ3_9RICK|nr:ribose-phosphate diphosphokinase [Candidatus Fokinia solitaria]AWD33109.1 Ribose-phosphate pyrophosphokinase [Candidatus Fokinia solitaria]
MLSSRNDTMHEKLYQKLKIIVGTNSQKIAQKIAFYQNAEYIQAAVQRFSNGEFSIQLHTSLYGNKAIIVHSIHRNVNDDIIELLLLANAAQNAGASKIIAIIPYIAYCRQDKQLQCEYAVTSPINTIAKIIKASAIECLLTVDIHSAKAREAFDMRFYNIDTTDLFASHIRNADNPLIISPDLGSAKRSKEIAEKLHCEHIIMKKDRSIGTALKQSDIKAILNKNCIIVDDIIDTGWTVINAAETLIKYGAKTIKAMISHAVLSQNMLFASHKIHTICEIITTSTIAHTNLPKYFKVLDISKTISRKISEITNN